MIVAIGHEVPDYRRPLRGPFGRALRMGVEGALNRFVDAIEDPSAEESSDLIGTYAELGRLEFHAGRSMDALQSAYRLGARMAWERFIVAASEQPPAVLYKLAAEIFSYIDRISAESVEGFVAEQSVAEAERGRRRAAVARLLARGIESDEELRAAGKEARWRPPATLAGLVTVGEDADRFAGRMGIDCVAVSEDGLILAFVPDPDGPGRRTQVTAALGDAVAVLGPTVAVDRSHLSLARAQAAHDLVREGVIADSGRLIMAERHLVEVMLHGDPVLQAEIAVRALAPLADLKPGSRERLTVTLRAWLDNPGQISRIAETLHVHPQTVRYRVGQLRELFGERLEDPDSRFELQLAVRSVVAR